MFFKQMKQNIQVQHSGTHCSTEWTLGAHLPSAPRRFHPFGHEWPQANSAKLRGLSLGGSGGKTGYRCTVDHRDRRKALASEKQEPAERRARCAGPSGWRRPFASPPTAGGPSGGAGAGRPLLCSAGGALALSGSPIPALPPLPPGRVEPRLLLGPHLRLRFRSDSPANWFRSAGRAGGRAERLGRSEQTKDARCRERTVLRWRQRAAGGEPSAGAQAWRRWPACGLQGAGARSALWGREG